ncbi:MAG: glycoside hydrolase family 13 protein [Gammaproteobacteria bacterium]|nr:glycoside hydrolase family 13 protein [Gammaproteobacteria bacterium]MDH3767313.1 glycoside hydrolase family 13 protein [Gammaproteobacteria bacterium]
MRPAERAATVFLILTLCLSQAAAFAQSIERVEPPSWWQGFRETTLQLLVYGKDLAGLRPVVNSPGIRVDRVVTTANPNYLFLYLDIGQQAKPGEFDINFSGKDVELTHRYRLEQKNADPDHVDGFGPEDAIYLITPDRFSNGDPENDNIKGMGDRASRSKHGGRHGGDIAGLIEHLDYIDNMGFTAVWLNPLLENRMPTYSYHGYATTDYYRVDPRFGSNEDYRQLVTLAKERSIDVIMDMIANHCGLHHWWMADLPSDDWINHDGKFVQTSHERTAVQDPYAASNDIAAFADGWFVDAMPDLNQRNPLLADYLIQNTLWWIEYLGLSGIRQDTYPYPDKNFMAEWTRRVMTEYPDFNIVGEEWSLNPAIVAYWQRGKQNHDGYVSHLPSVMDFPLQHALISALVEEERPHQSGLMKLYRMLANDFLYAAPGDLVIFGDNHDMARVYTQLGEDFSLYTMAMVYLLTMRGTPQIYYGTEILMTSNDDHDVIRAEFPGGWPDHKNNARTTNGLRKLQAKAQDFTRRLLQWRKHKPVIHNGKLAHYYPRDGVYTWFRYNDSDRIMAIINKNAKRIDLDLTRFSEHLGDSREATEVISGREVALLKSLRLDPRSVTLLDLH